MPCANIFGMTRAARFAIGFILSFANLIAQETTGSITGIVKDSTGAVIVGASVTANNQENAAEFRSTTDANGAYQFPLLRAGTYRNHRLPGVHAPVQR